MRYLLLAFTILSSPAGSNALTATTDVLSRRFQGFTASPQTIIGLRNHRGKSAASSNYHRYHPPAAILRGAAAGSDGDSSEDSKTGKMVEKIAGRKGRVKAGYAISLAGYGLFATLFASSLGALGCYVASGMFMASSVAYILRGAASNDRLKSDTYKRLNMALALYGLIGIVSRGVERNIVVRNAWTVLSLVTAVNSIKGYGYGLWGWELAKTNPLPELISGTKSYISTLLKIPKNPKSVGYLLATLFFVILKFSKLLEISQIVVRKEWGYMFCTRMLRYSKYMMLSTLAFTLKDAADRDRLNGTTFVQLNGILSLVSATMAGYSFSQASALNGYGAVLVSAFCAYNWVLSYLKD